MNRLQQCLEAWWDRQEWPAEYLRPVQKHGFLEVPLSAEPRHWLAGLSSATLRGRSAALLPPDLPITLKMDLMRALNHFEPTAGNQEWLILTGGTTSHGRWVRHSVASLCAAVDSYWSFYQKKNTRLSLIALPVYHVSGLMGWLRAVDAGIPALFCDYKDWLHGRFPDEDPEAMVLSLVPTQLERLLANEQATQWLQAVGRIHIGGAGARASLMARARELGLRIALGYGMTETAAMVCALPEDEFLNGACCSGLPMPGVELKTIGDAGRIALKTQALCLGYWPDRPVPMQDGWYLTDDAGRLDDGRLTVLGRLDRQINSGGEKVYPEAVEAALMDHEAVRDAIVWGEPDPEWGQRIVAAVGFWENSSCEVDALEQHLRQRLASAAIPREWRFGEYPPRKHNGKPDWTALSEWGK
ncbi:MAG: AMP-binding protein [Opitutales bacterium]|nr:AMP-binding protein [Opitutales bacterium]